MLTYQQQFPLLAKRRKIETIKSSMQIDWKSFKGLFDSNFCLVTYRLRRLYLLSFSIMEGWYLKHLPTQGVLSRLSSNLRINFLILINLTVHLCGRFFWSNYYIGLRDIKDFLMDEKAQTLGIRTLWEFDLIRFTYVLFPNHLLEHRNQGF